ncbi:MAG: carbon-nitrogen hydrolase family protein [Fimbriimonadales bacterium]
MVRVAAVQYQPDFADAGSNASRIATQIEILAGQGVELAVFPEAAVTGYCFGSEDEARGAAVSLESPEMKDLERGASGVGIWAVVGFAEDFRGRLFNSAALYGPDGLAGMYRKTHLPCLGLDRFVARGDSLPVFDTPVGKIGILICFDIRFPEPARTMALAGAEIICLPTNWPETAQSASDVLCPARAIENHVYVIASNRVGTENGFEFIGRSKIIAPCGEVLAALDSKETGAIVSNIDPTKASDKRIVRKLGEYEMDLFEARRPELYT